MAERLAFWSLLVLVLALVGCDRATKEVAQHELANASPVALVPGLLELRYVENRDSAFSLTDKVNARVKTPLLALTSSLGIVAVAFLVRRRLRLAGTGERVALALLVAGSVGNVAERLWRGYVVDFIYVHHWPVFNVADILVVLGMALLAVQAIGGRLRAA